MENGIGPPRDFRLLVVCCPLLARFWVRHLLKATCETSPPPKFLSQMTASRTQKEAQARTRALDG